jgi:HEAT repeat protein
VFRTISDPGLWLAAVTGVVAVALTLAIALLIVALRLQLGRHERRWQQFVALWRPALLGAMLSPMPPQLPELARRDQGLFLRLWTYLHESVRGDASDRLNRAAMDLSMDLKDPSAWDALLGLAHSNDGLISVNAARALIRIDPLLAAHWLMPLILARRDWEVTRVASFLVDAREAFWLLLIKSLPTLDPRDLPRALGLTEALRLQLPPATLRYLLGPTLAAEVICSALRLVAASELKDEVNRCLSHPDLQVRQQAALALGRLGSRDDVPRLLALLQDAHWPVRLAAAQALSALPFVSTGELVALQAEGSAANDVLRQVVAEREWA